MSGIIYTATHFDGAFVTDFLAYEALTDGAEIPSKCIEFYTRMALDPWIV